MNDLVKRADEALKDVTPGPWVTGAASWDDETGEVQYVLHGVFEAKPHDARFIAAARELVPAMRDRIEADAKQIAELEDI